MPKYELHHWSFDNAARRCWGFIVKHTLLVFLFEIWFYSYIVVMQLLLLLVFGHSSRIVSKAFPTLFPSFSAAERKLDGFDLDTFPVP